jgi:D-glycero-D-manno-heptose 1,7-bisphosphate phosphatase
MMKPAVFLDRDGTLNEQMGYINHVARFILLPRAAEAIRILKRSGYLVIVVSNQSGVARGYFPIQLVEEVHRHMQAQLAKQGAAVDGVFFCPHHPHGSVAEYRVDCECRKPKTGLIAKACEHFDIDMSRSYVVGDRYTDLEMAFRSELQGVLVRTGYGRGEIEYVLPGRPRRPRHVARDLLDAARWIIKKENGTPQ